MSEITRTEKFLRACIDGEPCALKPLTRVEKLLAELNDKLAGGGSASAGGGVCIVKVSCETADMQTFTNVTKDKAFAEMDAAYNAGGLVWGRLSVNSGGMIIKCEAPLGMCMEEEGVKGMMFFPFGFFGDAGVVIRVNEDDSCLVYIE